MNTKLFVAFCSFALLASMFVAHVDACDKLVAAMTRAGFSRAAIDRVRAFEVLRPLFTPLLAPLAEGVRLRPFVGIRQLLGFNGHAGLAGLQL